MDETVQCRNGLTTEDTFFLFLNLEFFYVGPRTPCVFRNIKHTFVHETQ